MKKAILLYTVNIFLFVQCSLAQEPIWAVGVSGPGSQIGTDADIDSQGNLFIVGHCHESSLEIEGVSYNTNGDGGDAFIAKFSPEHQLLWFKTLGGDDDSYNDEALDVHVDASDNVYLLVKAVSNSFIYDGAVLNGINSPGQNSGEGVILKLDNDGNYQWHDHGSVSSSFQNVATDSDNNVYLTGWFDSNIVLGDSIELDNPTNGTTKDMFVARYSSMGEIQWAKHFGGTEYNSFAYGNNIAIDTSTNILVVLSRISGEIHFETDTLSSLTSASALTALSAFDGSELWAVNTFIGMYSQDCQGLDISPDGHIGVAGYSGSWPDGPDGLIGFYDLNGNIQSESIFDTPGYCRLQSLAFNHLDECFVTGIFNGDLTIGSSPNDTILEPISSNTYRGLILKLDNNQVFSWANQFHAGFKNNVTVKDDRIVFSGRIGQSFVYNYGLESIPADYGEAIFAEIVDPWCPISITTDSQTACESFTWIDGNTYTSDNNTATFAFEGQAINGCDSVVKLDLTINNVDDITTSVSGVTITSNNSSAVYQWLDCDNNYAVISNESNRSFIPTENGNYAVQLTENGCIDTSACVTISSVGIFENDFGGNMKVYPNPTSGHFSVELDQHYEFLTVEILDLTGKSILSKAFKNHQQLNLELKAPAGIYLLLIQAEDKTARIRVKK